MSTGTARRESLDALRGLAMVVVLVYHIAPDLLPGGFVGLDVFFVLSGYLITALLLGERAKSGRISLRAFWGRRVRRLWPLSWTVLALVCVASFFGAWDPDQQRGLPGSMIAALLQVANWHQMSHGGYVDSFAGPSPIQHYWSLSLEEQFYLLWPPLLTLLLRSGRRVVVPLVVGVGVVASALAGLWIHAADRAYLGTDTRVVGILVGVLLAWFLRAHPLEGFTGAKRAMSLVLGGAATVLLCVLCFFLDITAVSEATLGFTALSLVSLVAVIGALNLPDMPAVMRPFAYIGRISFALYLVHWPLLVMLPPDASGLTRWLVGVPLSGVIAVFLHKTVEQPYIRRLDRPQLRFANVTLIGLAVVALVVSVPQGKTATEQVSASLGRVADPTANAPTTATATAAPDPTGATDPTRPDGGTAAPITTPGNSSTSTAAPATTLPPCIPETVDAPSFGSGSKFDPKTVENIPDPPTTACSGQLVVLILGDSTGRGIANGLVSLKDPRIQVWDRTTLGCSMGGESCSDWHVTWPEALEKIRPDVVIMHHGLVSDFKGVEDPPFMTPEGEAHREAQLTLAATMLQRTGATLYMISPPTPISPNALFYCKGKRTNSGCDPEWVEQWRSTVSIVAAKTGAQILDVYGWAAARGNKLADRPDGVHFTGAALQENARWLVNELVTRTPTEP